ncbi:fatty acid desaturase family protein [Micromonospora endolithica]|uniref:Acyl-CoA desaturase n=1 Tax=Micromonospora endolithica TaxID=230091 RepID=A0A3A9YVL6_9ACTN|nr:acyl-CoA desaturase [Micromonospora endolithica]RKN39970.1 acyl-CoA desaturase [Micromonospora endolithica]TWJ26140.1 fatty acid desaturase [Micromonospora endolithica]
MTRSLVAEPPARRGSDYSELSRRIRAAGLLTRRPGRYLTRIVLTFGVWLAVWAVVVQVGDSWLQVGLAAVLAVATTQVAFLGHDAGHRQMFRRRGPSELVGLVAGNLAVGLSYGWWVDKHNRHHANPNHADSDPDVGAGALVWTYEQASATRGLGRWVARRQAWFFFPMLLLEGLNLHVASLRAVFGRAPGGGFVTPMRHRAVEALLLVVHTGAYAGVLLVTMSPLKALAFAAVHQGLWGLYMGCAFAPNHKGMPMPDGDDDLDFLRKQVLTARNVRGSRFVDAALGGLNLQIEHHLFPNMPRGNLRRARPIVRAYCAEQGVPYAETGLIDSYRQALAHLHEVGRPLRGR